MQPPSSVADTSDATSFEASAGLLTAPRSIVEVPRISRRRGYLDGIGVFACAYGGAVAGAVVQGAALFGIPVSATVTHRLMDAASGLFLLTLLVTAVWWSALIATICARRWARRRPILATAVFGCLAIVAMIACLAASTVLRSDAPWFGMCCGLCLTLAYRRGVTPRTLGIRPDWAANRIGRWQAIVVGAVAYAAICAGPAAMVLFNAWAGAPLGSSHPDVAHPLALGLQVLSNGIGEELIVLAGLVTALEAARRPAWEIYLIGVAARLSFHLYYGPLALWIAIYAVASIWLYRRTRRLSMLIGVHLVYDSFVAFGALGVPVSVINLIAGVAAWGVGTAGLARLAWRVIRQPSASTAD